MREHFRRILEARPPKDSGGICKWVSSLNCYHAYEYLAGTRAKPWDERELDCLEGCKFVSFMLTTMSQTALALTIT